VIARSEVFISLGVKKDLLTKKYDNGAEEVKHLHSKHEAPNLNPSAEKNR
jgi:hypothetical protein